MRVVISDLKLDDGSGSFLPDEKSYTNFYPYGMPHPNRSWEVQGDNYRYGFNGVEKEQDVYGKGNLSAMDFRMYDSRVGRWWGVDKIVKVYESPYAAMAGNPVNYADPSGLDTDPPVTGYNPPNTDATNTQTQTQTTETTANNESWLTGLINTIGDAIGSGLSDAWDTAKGVWDTVKGAGSEFEKMLNAFAIEVTRRADDPIMQEDWGVSEIKHNYAVEAVKLQTEVMKATVEGLRYLPGGDMAMAIAIDAPQLISGKINGPGGRALTDEEHLTATMNLFFAPFSLIGGGGGKAGTKVGQEFAEEAIEAGVRMSADDVVYEGVRAASKYLQEAGVPREFRKKALESFEIQTISLRVADESTFALRFFGGDAWEEGRFLFPTFTNYTNRANMALPYSWNTMTGFTQFQIRPGSIYLFGRAGPQLQEGVGFIGGSYQLYINDLSNLLRF